jgi:hypothetical protein
MAHRAAKPRVTPQNLQTRLAASMDAAQAALQAAYTMPVKDKGGGCHAIKEAAIAEALRRISLCQAAAAILDPLTARLRAALSRPRHVPHDLG